MRSLHPLCVVVFLLGLALGTLRPSDLGEASAAGVKGAPKAKPAPQPKAPKAPKPPRPTVTKMAKSHVSPLNGKSKFPVAKSPGHLGDKVIAGKTAGKPAAGKTAGKPAAKEPEPHGNPAGKTAGNPAAGKTPGKSVAKEPEPQQVSDAQLAQGLRVLQSVKMTLDAADHDYGGHRAATVKDVAKAEKQLRDALKFQGKKTAGGTPPEPPRQPEPQKLSDAELRAAIPVLEQTVAVLGKADHDYGGHRASAIADLKVAVTQLKKALTSVK